MLISMVNLAIFHEKMQCCGSGWIGMSLPDPDLFKPNLKLNNTFFQEISIYYPKY
jgi:hypothetical protein